LKLLGDWKLLPDYSKEQQQVMRYAVKNGLIDYNPAQEMAGAIAGVKEPTDRHYRLIASLNSWSELKYSKVESSRS
jgi:hypothetical protein